MMIATCASPSLKTVPSLSVAQPNRAAVCMQGTCQAGLSLSAPCGRPPVSNIIRLSPCAGMQVVAALQVFGGHSFARLQLSGNRRAGKPEFFGQALESIGFGELRRLREEGSGRLGATRMEGVRAAASGSKDDSILLVGATGGTGGSVLDGLLASGIAAESLHVLTRNPSGKGAQALASRGVHVVSGDLDDEESVRNALKGKRAMYCHATSKDAAKADPIGDIRAEKLARAAKSAGIQHIVYNSSGGRGADTKISQVDQKHHIEDLFIESGIPTTNLQATLFMEEFWKITTRPAIQKGTFPFSMPADKPLQLLAVKDMGRAAGTALLQPEEYGGKSLELAGDQLTPLQLCEKFSKAQGGSPVKQLSLPKFLFWFLNKDLYRIIKFLSEKGYTADIEDCRGRFPGMLTFQEFLELTQWGDSKRTYEGGFRY